jgi:hypothetical protein
MIEARGRDAFADDLLEHDGDGSVGGHQHPLDQPEAAEGRRLRAHPARGRAAGGALGRRILRDFHDPLESFERTRCRRGCCRPHAVSGH